MRKGLMIILAGILLLGAIAVGIPHGSTAGESVQAVTNINGDYLRTVLVKGLLATRADQRAFIDKVVKKVEEGKLPVKIVYAAFDWARERRPDYPYPYFMYAVRTLAKRYEVVL